MKNFLYKNLLNFADFSWLYSLRSLTFAAAAAAAPATATATAKAKNFSSINGGKNINMILKYARYYSTSLKKEFRFTEFFNASQKLDEQVVDYVPLTTYSNADTFKAIILSDNKGKSGIYRWVNNNNNKSYVGSAVDLKERFINYYNINHLIGNSSMLINRALIKYGYSNFSLEILEYCKPEERFERENYYLGSFEPEYNILKVANVMPDRTGVKASEESILKRIINHPKRIVISVTDTLTNTEVIYDSIRRAEIDLGTTNRQIGSHLLKKGSGALFRKRYIIEKLDYPSIVSPDMDKVVESWRSGIKLDVTDLQTNTTTSYSSIREAARNLEMADRKSVV